MFRIITVALGVAVLTTLPGDRWPKGYKGEPPAARVDRVDIVDKGIYRAEVLEIIPDPHSPTGTRERIGNITLQQDTTSIPRIKNSRFGLRYSITGVPSGGQVALKIIVIYPEGGPRSHRTGTAGDRDEFPLVQLIGSGPYYWGFRMDDDTALGVWDFQVWVDQRMLAEQTFNIVRP
jgi:hypothetical protein